MTKQELLEALQPYQDNAEVNVAYFLKNVTLGDDVISVCDNGPSIQLSVEDDYTLQQYAVKRLPQGEQIKLFVALAKVLDVDL